MLVKRSYRPSHGPTPPPAGDLQQNIRDLDGPDIALRRKAAQALGDDPHAVPHLCHRLPIEPAPTVRAAILASLIRLKSPEVVEGLVNFLRSEDAALRNAIIEALQSMPEQALPTLISLLRDDDSDVRIFAVNILNEVQHPDACALLARVIIEDSHINVCMTAVDGIAEIGDETMVEPLQKLGERFPETPYVQFAVAGAIQRVSGAR